MYVVDPARRPSNRVDGHLFNGVSLAGLYHVGPCSSFNSFAGNRGHICDARCAGGGEEARYGLFYSHGGESRVSVFLPSPSFPDYRNRVLNAVLMYQVSFSDVTRSATNRPQLSAEDRFISTVDRFTHRGMWRYTALFGPVFHGVV